MVVLGDLRPFIVTYGHFEPFCPMKIPRSGFFKVGKQRKTGSINQFHGRKTPPYKKQKPDKLLHLFILVCIYLINSVL